VFAGDVPNPAYDSGAWRDLCSASLHDQMNIGNPNAEDLMDLAARGHAMPDVIPPDFAARWLAAADLAFAAMPVGMTAAALNEAYLFHWLVLWFRTSGAVIPCNATPPLVPPGNCGNDPNELDPFVNGVPLDGNVPQPPPATIDADLDIGAIICGITLAIIGGVLILTANVALGGAAIAGAVSLFDCDSATDLDWEEIRCLIFHERMYLHNALVGIHRLMVLAGLDHPHAKERSLDQDFQDLFPFLEPWESGKNLTKSKTDKSYPGQAWDGSLLNFNRPPTVFETPGTTAFNVVGYADVFIDDAAHPPVGTGVADAAPVGTWADGGPYKSLGGVAGHSGPQGFGAAVPNAVTLLTTALAQPLPNWNLDANRGLSSLNWRFEANYNPADVKIKPE
jgi:hypothetical protein